MIEEIIALSRCQPSLDFRNHFELLGGYVSGSDDWWLLTKLFRFVCGFSNPVLCSSQWSLISSVTSKLGLYRNKVNFKNAQQLDNLMVKCPRPEELESLAGVGRKTANGHECRLWDSSLLSIPMWADLCSWYCQEISDAIGSWKAGSDVLPKRNGLPIKPWFILGRLLKPS